MSTPEPEKDAPTAEALATVKEIGMCFIGHDSLGSHSILAALGLLNQHDKHQLNARDTEIARLNDQLGLQARAAKTWEESAQAAYKREDDLRTEIAELKRQLAEAKKDVP